MPAAPKPQNEQERLKALRSYHILDTATETDFDELTQLASAICDTPIALISFVDEKRQWFKSHRGLNVSETDRALSFCAHAIHTPGQMLEVEDAKNDKRFEDNALVTGYPDITFYAGVPLVDEHGAALGSLCVIDKVKRKLNPMQAAALKTLAHQVVNKLALRKKVLEVEATGTRIQKLNELLLVKEREAMQIVEHAPSAMALHIGEDMNIRFANKTMLKAWGKDETVFGMPFKKALPELEKLDFPRTMRQVYRKGIPYEQTEAHMSYMHNGKLTEFYYTYAFTPLTLADGTVWGILNTAVDVTQIVKSRLAVEATEERLRLAVESAELGTWYINAETREFVPSVRLKALFGFDPHETMSYEAAINQIRDDHRARVRDAVESTIAEKAAFDIEYPIIGFRDGVLRWVKATGKIFPATEQGKAPFFSGTMVDITERREDEERKNDFISMVSHELKTPLTSLKGFVQLLNMKATRENATGYINTSEKAITQIRKMETLIKGFLDVTKFGSGKLYLNKQPFDIAAMIGEVVDEARLTTSGHELNYTQSQPITLRADRDKIAQVINNLISNAIKYSAQGKPVEVSIEQQPGEVKISIKDEGFGVKPEDREKLFERFYRVENSQTNYIAGFGIGLYICAEIIKEHSGHIGVNSEVGEGSTFWFTLPVGGE